MPRQRPDWRVKGRGRRGRGLCAVEGAAFRQVGDAGAGGGPADSGHGGEQVRGLAHGAAPHGETLTATDLPGALPILAALALARQRGRRRVSAASSSTACVLRAARFAASAA